LLAHRRSYPFFAARSTLGFIRRKTNLLKYLLPPQSLAAGRLLVAVLSLTFIISLGGVKSLDAAFASELNAAAVALNNRGVALMGQFNYEAALHEFSKLAELYPDNSVIQINCALAYLNRQTKGDEKRALAILNRVLERDPQNLRALYSTGIITLYLGEPREAAPYFLKVLGFDPKDQEALYFLGQTFLQMSQYDESIEYFKRSIALDPYLTSAYYGLFTAFQRLDKRQEARDMMECFQGIKKNPRSHLMEFKCMKMGRKAQVTVIGEPKIKPPKKLEGPLFSTAQPLLEATEEIRWADPGYREQSFPGMTVCDINGDGWQDLFITGVIQGPDGRMHNAVVLAVPSGTRFLLAQDHPLAKIENINACLWGDYDNDGLTDVYFCRHGPNQLWRQTGKDQWQDVTNEAQAANMDFDTVDGAFFDADHDGDLDLFLINADGPNELLSNNRDGSFLPIAHESNLTGNGNPSRSLVLADLDSDRDADIIVINRKPPHEIYVNDRTWEYHSASGWEDFSCSDIIAAVAGDIDTDGWPEVYTLDSQAVLTRWRRNKEAHYTGTKLLESRSPEPVPSSTAVRLALADVNGDAILDLMGANQEGWWVVSVRGETVNCLFSSGAKSAAIACWALAVLDWSRGPALVGWSAGAPPTIWPPGPGRYPFTAVTLTGREDQSESMRSNASGIGTRLSVRSGSRWTVMDTFRNHSGPGQGIQPLAVGLADADSLDFVAIDWPDGVYQTELDLKGGSHHVIAEIQRQLSSCPVVFAWNGSRFEFVSDILGVGGIGYALGPGEYARPRPWERLLLPEDSLKPKGDRLVVKVHEPMEEVTYLDALSLVAYDLPPGWAMGLDERMGISGPEPTGRSFFFRTQVIPIQAVNDRGEDVTALVTSRDLRAAPIGKADQRFLGRLKRDHVLTLTFASPLDSDRGTPVLLAEGWNEYPYSSTNFAAWQAGADFRAPTLEARAIDGTWHKILEQFGYPAGMPRPMSVPLPWLPQNTCELRISTNQEIYWDWLAVAYPEPCPEATIYELPLMQATLIRSGFPERHERPQRVPCYDYHRRKPSWDTRYLEGYYTRIGHVEALIQAKDDAVAIFGPGEEIQCTFTSPEKPVKDGWTRRYVLEAYGWCKDMDLYTQDGETIEPLPRLGPESESVNALHRKLNTRYLSGQE